MHREGRPPWLRRRLLAALLAAGAFLGTITRAQSPQTVAPDEHRGYRDLVVLAKGTYGVELRGTDDPARVEARVGPNTSLADKFRSARFLAKTTQPFVVKWSAREVSVNAGGQSINHRAAWQTGDAVRVSARGDARVTIVKAGGKRVGQTIAGTASPGTPSDLILAGAHLTGNWTLEGTIDWPDEPGPDDAVLVTVGRQDPASPATRSPAAEHVHGRDRRSVRVFPAGWDLATSAWCGPGGDAEVDGERRWSGFEEVERRDELESAARAGSRRRRGVGHLVPTQKAPINDLRDRSAARRHHRLGRLVRARRKRLEARARQRRHGSRSTSESTASRAAGRC